MEFTHRTWGRVLGLVFAVPAAYFVARGAVTRRLGTRLGLLFLMGGTQGFVGWWMVKSGLQACTCLPTAPPPPVPPIPPRRSALWSFPWHSGHH